MSRSVQKYVSIWQLSIFQHISDFSIIQSEALTDKYLELSWIAWSYLEISGVIEIMIFILPGVCQMFEATLALTDNCFFSE